MYDSVLKGICCKHNVEGTGPRRRFSGSAVWWVSLLLAAACSSPPTAPQSSSRVRSEETPSGVALTGVLEGEVLFEGTEILHPTYVENTTDPQHCGATQSLRDIIISRDNKGVKDAIVALRGVPLPEDYQLPASQLTIDNRSCQFQPHVAVLTVGSRIEATNSDPIFHSVHFYGSLNRNLALGPQQSKVVRTVSRPGFYIIKCDVHGWMQAFIRVDAHPFHSTSDAAGGFRIENIPVGVYRLEAWHEYFGTTEVEVEIKPDQPSRVSIVFRDQSP